MGIKDSEYRIIREGEDVILRVNYQESTHFPSLEENPLIMSKTIDYLIEMGDITRIVFYQKRDYEYNSEQTAILKEIAMLYKFLVNQKQIFSYDALNVNGECKKFLDQWYTDIQTIVFHLIKSDPIQAYVRIRRLIRREKITLEKTIDTNVITCLEKYISTLTYFYKQLDKTRLVSRIKTELSDYKIGKRDLYRRIFHPTIKPDFMYTKLMASYPEDGEELDNYALEDTEVTIFGFSDKVQSLYHIIPPEFKLDEYKYEILDSARKIMAEHKPKKSEFVDPERMRKVFYNVGSDLIQELASYKNIKLRAKEVERLTEILVRYTVGFGLIEILLQDPKIQDISINSPMGQTPIFIVHQDFDDCKTNIIPTRTEAESWASKLRLLSGRPLDEANPILDTELQLPKANTRVAVVSKPFNPTGLAYSFRRHRDKPWTIPLFIENKMINPLAGGLLSFLIDGNRSILIAGTRSSGKSSLLSSALIEIMRKYRVITIEDTLELPTDQLRKLGYNIQSLKVASALQEHSSEISASAGIRSTLRLGDSSLIIGEVRSKEAKALYEAMRVGAAANVVAGTIHGDSPYGVFDRVVNDIGIPKTSFKATDIIVVTSPIRTAGGLHKERRVTQITEVRKRWENDPLLEGAFVDLMKYNVKKDELEPTDELINGESEILKVIAANIKEFAGSWDAIWENIELRANIKKELTDTAKKLKDYSLLEAPFVLKSNDSFHVISESIKEEFGFLDSKKIFSRWKVWLKKEINKKMIK